MYLKNLKHLLFLFSIMFVFLSACNSGGDEDKKKSNMIAGEFKQTTKKGVKKKIYAKVFFPNREVDLGFISPATKEDTGQTMGSMRFEIGDELKIRWGYNEEHDYVNDYKLTHEKIFDTSKFRRFKDQIGAIELVFHGDKTWELKLYDSNDLHMRKEIVIEDETSNPDNEHKEKPLKDKDTNKIENDSQQQPELVWKFGTKSWIYSSPEVVDETVYIGSEDGYLYAVDAKEGNEQWKFHAEHRIYSGNAIHAGPVVENQTVYFGSTDEHFYAVERKTGKKRWSVNVDGSIYGSPAFQNGIIYFGDHKSNYFHALNATNGKEIWKQKIWFVYSKPFVKDQKVYIGNYSNTLYSFNSKTGEKKWMYQIKKGKISRGFSSPYVSNGIVYAGCSDGFLYAIDSKTGNGKWKTKISDSFTKGYIQSAPIVTNDIVYIGSKSGYLYAINGSDGKVKWKFETEKAVDSTPAVSNGVVYVGSDDKHLYAIDAETGKKKWAFKTGRVVDSSPAVTKDRIYVGSRDGYLYAIKKQK